MAHVIEKNIETSAAPCLGWSGAGQWDWMLDEVPPGAVEVERLGERRLHGLRCDVGRWSDGRVRAVPEVK
jgi:hypothetical protein